MNYQTKEKYINKEVTVRDPVVLDDGSMIFDCTFTTDEPDRDGDIVNPLGVKGLETAVVAYNHKKCDGVPVSTGAEIMMDSVVQTEKELRVQIKVSPTDEMFYCDYDGAKKTNGKLLEAINKGQVKNISMGIRFDKKSVLSKTIKGKTYNYYPEVLLIEVSLLDVVSSNLKSTIHKFMNITPEDKAKCLSCLVEAGIGTFAINPDNQVVKITELDQSTETYKAMDFEGNEVILDDSYEPVSYDMQEEEKLGDETPPPAEATEKVCGCQKAKLDEVATKAPETPEVLEPAEATEKVCGCQKAKLDEVATKAPETPEVLEPEEVAETVKLEAIQATIQSLESKLADIMAKLEATPAQELSQEQLNKFSEQIEASINKAVQTQTLDKFIQTPEIEKIPTNNINKFITSLI